MNTTNPTELELNSLINTSGPLSINTIRTSKLVSPGISSVACLHLLSFIKFNIFVHIFLIQFLYRSFMMKFYNRVCIDILHLNLPNRFCLRQIPLWCHHWCVFTVSKISSISISFSDSLHSSMWNNNTVFNYEAVITCVI